MNNILLLILIIIVFLNIIKEMVATYIAKKIIVKKELSEIKDKLNNINNKLTEMEEYTIKNSSFIDGIEKAIEHKIGGKLNNEE